MRILLTGATGFIGSRLAHALQLAGHRVVLAVRDVDAAQRLHPGADPMAVDFARDISAEHWLPRLDGVDAVINAVGIFVERGAQRFETLHVRGPCALFEACARKGVRRVIQLSALGADETAATGFLRSKCMADDFLLALPLRAVVVQPSLVFGTDGASSQLFGLLASLPVLALPDGGRHCVQPVHVDDVVAAIVRLLDDDRVGRVPAVGPQPLSLRRYIAALRAQLGHRRQAVVLAIPSRWLLRLANRLRSQWLSADALHMLRDGNCADARPFAAVLGRAPRPATAFVAEPRSWRRALALASTLPMLRASIALLWIVTGLLSLGIYPVADSLELLARSGVPPALRAPALYAAAVLDIALGCAVLLQRGRRAVWLAQAVLIVAYTTIITWKLPEFWLHPYAPVLKNIPLLAALGVLHAAEDRRT